MTAAPLVLLSLLITSMGRADEPDIVRTATRVIEERMGEGADARLLHAAAVRGMALWLDEQGGAEGSGLLTQAEYEQLMARVQGERIGLGIEFTVAPGRGLLVAEIFEGSPADKAGLIPGDLVVAIDDLPFTGVSAQGIHAVVSELAERPREQRVVLDLRREDGALRRAELTPSPFRTPKVSVDEGEDRLILRIGVIGPGTAQAVARAMKALAGRALVLDLRDLDEADLEALPDLAGVFLGPDVPVLRALDPKGQLRTIRSRGEAQHEARLVVLVNRGTAGLAEGLAHALRTHGRAVLVGTRSAGRASHPSFHPIGEDLVLKLTDTVLQAEDGSTWASQGLGPDLVVEPLQVPLVGAARTGLPDIQVEAGVRFISAP